MKINLTVLIFFYVLLTNGYAQKYSIDYTKKPSLVAFADSIRQASEIPELGFAMATSDSIVYLETLGEKRYGSGIKAERNDKFHIGSNSKAFTGFIAALLVDQNKIKWDTKFFDLFPDLKEKSKSDFYDITLQDLLSHRAGIIPMDVKENFRVPILKGGNCTEARLVAAQWLLKQKIVKQNDKHVYSNAGYGLAALMLEKASGKSWEELITDLGNKLNIKIAIGFCNNQDSTQPWAHIGTKPLPINDKSLYRLKCFDQPSGDLNLSLPDYVKWVQINLQGLQGKSPYLNQQTFEFLHYGIPDYAIGWTWTLKQNKEKADRHFSTHDGTHDYLFYCHATLIKELDIAIIIVTNQGNDLAQKGVYAMRKKLFNVFDGMVKNND